MEVTSVNTNSAELQVYKQQFSHQHNCNTGRSSHRTPNNTSRQMRVKRKCSSVSLTLLLVYAVSSLVFLRPPLRSVGPNTANNYNGNNGHDHHYWGTQPRIRSASGADSIVFIALGPAARSTSLLYALTSLREEGRWGGAVHVIVEHEDDLDCLSSYLRQSVTAIAIAPTTSNGGSSSRGGSSHPVFADGGELAANTTGAVGLALGATGGSTGTAEGKGRLAAEERAGGAAAVVESVSTGDASGATGAGSEGGRSKPGGVVVNNAKMAKMQLLDLLPPSVKRVVYVDCDVITQRSLGPFLDSVAQGWNELDRKAEAAAAAAAVAAAATTVAEKVLTTTEGPKRPAERLPSSRLREERADTNDFGSGSSFKKTRPLPSSSSAVIIFEGAAGHTIPVCRGCDGAHSGVVALARGHSERCLELWYDAFRGDTSGRREGTATDQEALDVALRQGSGCEARWIGRQHMSFMKDAFVMAGLTRTSTFGHFTGLLHPEKLGAVYRRFYEWALGRGFEEWGQGEIEACAVG